MIFHLPESSNVKEDSVAKVPHTQFKYTCTFYFFASDYAEIHKVQNGTNMTVRINDNYKITNKCS